MAHTTDDHALADRLQEVVQGCADRSTKLLSVCEDVWTRLGGDPAPAEDVVQSLIALLRDKDNFLLANLSIPELRPYEDPPRHPLQQRVVAKLSQTSEELRALCWPTRDGGGKPSAIASEKRIFQQAELYRASLLLLNSGSVPDDKLPRIKEWLDAAPFTTDSDEHAQTDCAPSRDPAASSAQ